VSFPPIRLQQAWNLGGLSLRELATRTWQKVQQNELMTRAAAVAFYAMLALVPFLALMITLVAVGLPDLTGQTGEAGIGNTSVEQFEATVKQSLGEESYEIIGGQIARIQEDPPAGLLSFGVLISIWLASSLFVAVIDAMNAVYGVEETRPMWKTRLIAIGMTVLQTIILGVALVSIAAWPVITDWLGLGLGAAWIATIVRWLVIWLMVIRSFAAVFYVAPDAETRWEWITPGSFFGALLFLIATYGFGLYVRNFANYNETYGSLGGVMILLFWFWLSATILLAAGQTNKVIEHAAPLGNKEGQKADTTEPPDLAHIEPRRYSEEPAR